MNSSNGFSSDVSNTTSIFTENHWESNTTIMANFSSNGTGLYSSYDGSLLDGNVFNTNISANSSEYPGYGEYNDTYYSYDNYTPTPAATAIVLVIFGLILLVGIVGNILVIIVIAAVKSMHTIINKCLFSLALADLIILIMLPISPIQGDFTNNTLPLGTELCQFLNFYDRGAIICSLLTFYYVTIDRYFALCYPLKSRALWTGRKTYVVLVAIWVISLALSYPYLYTSKYEEYFYDNASHYSCYFDTIDNKWMEWYDISFSVLTISVPIPVLFVMYGKMIYRIRCSVPKSGSGNKGNDVAGRRGRRQVVGLLLTVVIIFMVSQLPFAFLQVFDYYFPTVFNLSDYDENTFTITWFARILIYVNSAANPVIYFSLSTNFRQGLQQVFCCLGRKKSQKQSQETRSSSF